MEQEVAHIFATNAHAYDISDHLTDITFTDEMGLYVVARMTKERAKVFRDQLSEMLAKPTLEEVLKKSKSS